MTQSCRDLPDRQQVEDVRKQMQSLLRSFDDYFRTSTSFQSEWKGKEKKYNDISAEFAAFAREWRNKEKKYNDATDAIKKATNEWKGKETKYNDILAEIKSKIDGIQTPQWWEKVVLILVPALVTAIASSTLGIALNRLVNWTFDEQSGLSYYVKYIAAKSNVINTNINQVINWMNGTYRQDHLYLQQLLNQRFADINTHLFNISRAIESQQRDLAEIYRGQIITNTNINSVGTAVINRIDGLRFSTPIVNPVTPPQQQQNVDLKAISQKLDLANVKLDQIKAIDFVTTPEFNFKINPLISGLNAVSSTVTTTQTNVTETKGKVDLLPTTIFQNVNDGFRNFTYRTFFPETQILKNWINNAGGGTDDSCCRETQSQLNDLLDNLTNQLGGLGDAVEAVDSTINTVNNIVTYNFGTGEGGQEESQLQLLEKIYQILGGNDWFSEGITAGISIDPKVKLDTAMPQTFEDGKKLTRATKANNILQYFERYLTLFFVRAGYEEYPLTVPKSLVRLKTDTTTPNEPTTEDLIGVGQFDIWQFKQLDSLFGQFPINIKIEDNDLIKTGDQPIEIELPNIAETLAELTVKTITNEATIDVLTNMLTRSLIQNQITYQEVTKNYYALLAFEEYVGYESKKKRIEIPTVIKFPQGESVDDDAINNIKFDEFLDASKLAIEVDDCTEKQSLEQKLAEIIEAARILKGTRYRRFTKGLGQGLIDELTDLYSRYKDYDKTDEESFADYLDRVEDGFIDTAGMTDPDKPYGKPNNRRPLIKDLSARSEEEQSNP